MLNFDSSHKSVSSIKKNGKKLVAAFSIAVVLFSGCSLSNLNISSQVTNVTEWENDQKNFDPYANWDDSNPLYTFSDEEVATLDNWENKTGQPSGAIITYDNLVSANYICGGSDTLRDNMNAKLSCILVYYPDNKVEANTAQKIAVSFANGGKVFGNGGKVFGNDGGEFTPISEDETATFLLLNEEDNEIICLSNQEAAVEKYDACMENGKPVVVIYNSDKEKEKAATEKTLGIVNQQLFDGKATITASDVNYEFGSSGMSK